MKRSPEVGSGARSAKLAWVVLILEAALFLGAVLVFSRYWIMLPIRYRVMGVIGLAVVGLIGVIRVGRLALKRG
jgi:hypothetical protein